MLTSEDLNALLSEHDEMWLVTGKAKGYSALLRQIPFPQRMLMEVFFHRGWRQARAAGVVYPTLNVGTMNIRKIWKMAFLGVDMVTVDLRELVAQRDLFEWLLDKGLPFWLIQWIMKICFVPCTDAVWTWPDID